MMLARVHRDKLFVDLGGRMPVIVDRLNDEVIPLL
jgi:hypothetical protein